MNKMNNMNKRNLMIRDRIISFLFDVYPGIKRLSPDADFLSPDAEAFPGTPMGPGLTG